VKSLKSINPLPDQCASVTQLRVGPRLRDVMSAESSSAFGQDDAEKGELNWWGRERQDTFRGIISGDG
jgi:hypothetical protein